MKTGKRINKNNSQFSILNSQLCNKGFSLVELIIVIAIMAILIAVLAPMFLRYVERSRQSVDANSVGEMLSTLRAASVDTNIDPSPGGTYTLIWNCGGDGSIEVIPVSHEPAVHEFVGERVSAKSTSARTAGATITIIIDIDAVTQIAVSNNINPADGQNQHFLDILDTIS